jgi:hypothetical protein
VQSRVLHEQSNPARIYARDGPERNGTKEPPPSPLSPPAYIRLPRLLYHDSTKVSNILFLISAIAQVSVRPREAPERRCRSPVRSDALQAALAPRRPVSCGANGMLLKVARVLRAAW